MKTKIAIYVSGGVVQSVISNTEMVDIEIMDADNEPENTETKWNEINKELGFAIY
jgi:hypothetical protein